MICARETRRVQTPSPFFDERMTEAGSDPVIKVTIKVAPESNEETLVRCWQLDRLSDQMVCEEGKASIGVRVI